MSKITYFIDETIVVENFEDEMIILTSDGGIHYLNQTAKIVWGLIEKGLSPEEIAEELSKIYDIPKEEALTDTQQLIGELLSKALISENSGK